MEGFKSSLFGDFSHRRNFGPMPKYTRVEKYEAPDYGGTIKIAGPCSVESPEQIWKIAEILSEHKVNYLRGGIFRAGTYPSDNRFGFVDEKLIAEFSRAAHDNGMKCLIEVLDYHPDSLKLYDKYADAYQIGARHMQNYTLLYLIGKRKRPVFLKRNVGATIDEFLGAAEHLLKAGQCEPFLIERGSSTFHNHVRWDLSISIIPAIKEITKIPVIVDASHGTGRRDLVGPMTLAGIASGADGYLVETHYDPDKSLSDPQQSYPLSEFGKLAEKAEMIYSLVK